MIHTFESRREQNKRDDLIGYKIVEDHLKKTEENDKYSNQTLLERTLSECQLSEADLQEIMNNQWLSSDHIETFANMMRDESNNYYSPELTLKCQIPTLIKPVCPLKRHIQILYTNAHWICSYYDSKNIFIYDSMNRQKCNKNEKVFLKYLSPHYSFTDSPIKFPKI